VSAKERVRKTAGEKDVFTQKPPVDGPFEKELSAQIECTTQIFFALAFDKERQRRRKLDSLKSAN